MNHDRTSRKFIRLLEAISELAFPNAWEMHTKEEDGLRTITILITNTKENK